MSFVRRPPRVVVHSPHRRFAMWVESPRIFPTRSYPRTYNPKMVLLKERYLSILDSGQPLLFVKHKDFKAKQLIRLRSEIASASITRKQSSGPPSILTPEYELREPARLTGVRTTVLGVAFRECEHLDARTRRLMKKFIGKGAIFILSMSSMDPAHLTSILRILDRAVPPKPLPLTPEALARAKADAEAEFVPGKEQKRVRPNHIPQLELVGALIESRAYSPQEVREISKLPTLDNLRGAIVGLLARPAGQLLGVLSQASGGQLSRTLQGFQRSLESQ